MKTNNCIPYVKLILGMNFFYSYTTSELKNTFIRKNNAVLKNVIMLNYLFTKFDYSIKI